jgi:transposase-like protein
MLLAHEGNSSAFLNPAEHTIASAILQQNLKASTDSWRVDETYVKVKGEWTYLYRAVDSEGNTREFFLSATRDAQAAKRFFSKTQPASHTVVPG